MDIVDKIIAYEHGNLDVEAAKELFQELVDSGLVWTLQGHYGRVAQHLLKQGDILPANRLDKNPAKPSFGPVSA